MHLNDNRTVESAKSGGQGPAKMIVASATAAARRSNRPIGEYMLNNAAANNAEAGSNA